MGTAIEDHDEIAVEAQVDQADSASPLSGFIAVSLGGAIGACGRFLAGELIDQSTTGSFPLPTLLVNVGGSFLLAWYLASTEQGPSRPATRLFLATGLIGALTTFSTFSYETIDLMRDGDVLVAVGYGVLTVSLGLLAAATGYAVGRRNRKR